jgi:tRNA(fMet)-specific endonuclease VapC
MVPVMLDTSACIEILRGREPPASLKKRRFALSSVVEAELWAGVYHSGGQNERRKVEALLAAVETVPFDSAAAEATGKVLGNLTRLGRKIGDFDAQIAGHAKAAHAALLTKNPKHFSRVDGLEVIVWTATGEAHGS